MTAASSMVLLRILIGSEERISITAVAVMVREAHSINFLVPVNQITYDIQ
jgi:hypothetical protein